MKVHFKYGKNGLNIEIPDNLSFTILNAPEEKETDVYVTGIDEESKPSANQG